jgi:hypothetical protein
MDMPERFAGLVVMNTAMPTGGPISDGFAVWKQFASMAPEIPVAGLLATDAREAMDIMDALAYAHLFRTTATKLWCGGFRRLFQSSLIWTESNYAEGLATSWHMTGKDKVPWQ